MAEKFTYFDFQMYVLPGAVLLTGALAAWAIGGGTLPPILGDSGLFASVLFILTAFVAGHFVQTLAHALPERLLKRAFWGGYYPSQILFFRGHKLLTAVERNRFTAALVEHEVVPQHAVAAWETELKVGWFRAAATEHDASALATGIEAAQFAFNHIRHTLSGDRSSLRVRSAEASYQFFRGSATSAALSAVFLLLETIFLGNEWPFLGLTAVDSVALGITLTSASVAVALAFLWRARGAGQNLAREVHRAFLARAPQTESQGH